MKTRPQLRHGSEWADHEDCLVGDEAGLRRLRQACEVALRDGEYFGDDLGEFVGVKKLDSTWFQNPQDSKSTRIGNVLVGTAMVAGAALAVLGLVSVIKWFV